MVLGIFQFDENLFPFSFCIQHRPSTNIHLRISTGNMTVENVKQVFVSGGKTYVKHSPTADKIYVCSNNILKIFDFKNSEHEPEVIDVLSKVNSFELSNNSSKNYCVITSQTGECEYYDLTNLKSMGKLIRSPLALRDAVFTHSGSMVLCGGSDGELKLISLDGSDIKKLDTRDQVSSIAYNNVGDLAAVSLSNGDLIVYSYSSSEPTKVHTFDKIVTPVTSMDDDDDDDDNDGFNDFDDADFNDEQGETKTDRDLKLITTKADWHPDGDLLAVPTKLREIHVYDRTSFDELDFKFKGQQHEKPIVDLRWSPNGKYLASVGLDKRLIVYETKYQKSTKVYTLPKTACSLSWGKTNNNDYEIIVGTKCGHIITFDSIVKQSPSSNSMVMDEADEGNEEENEKAELEGADDTEGRDDDNLEGDEDMTGLFGEEEDDFIVDDDGNGYAEKKRPAPTSSLSMDPSTINGLQKHRKLDYSVSYQSQEFDLKPFSPGATPWNSNRRYLTINPIGYAWAVKQESYNTITVSFFDRSLHKEYHFRDLKNFDVSSMNDEGILFASSNNGNKLKRIATIMYTTHDQQSWERTFPLQPGEIVTSAALSKSTIFISTSHGFIRRYSLFGRIERIEKTAPVVACVNNDKYLFTVTLNNSTLSFNLQDHEGKYFQRNEHLPIQPRNSKNKHPIKGLFFSLDGDPCIVGQDDYLLVLSRWRDPLQASWIPMLDTKTGVKQIASGDNVRCWPLGLFKDQFNFIVVRGAEYPSFPLALPAEIPIKLPISTEDEGNDGEEADEEDGVAGKKGATKEDPEEQLVRYIALGELLNDAIANDDVLDDTAHDRLTEITVKYDRSLLKQFGDSCVNSDLMDALYLATRMREDRALMAASKMAERLELTTLVNKITALRESRMEFD